MVATIQILSGGASATSAYHGLMASNGQYYVSGHRSQWFGHAAYLLNLDGPVGKQDFENLLSGRTPGGQRLGNIRPDSPKTKTRRVPGLDLTLSVPKPLSVLWAISGDQLQSKISDILMKAARLTVDDIERDIPLARRGRGGQSEINSQLVVAMFLHTLSRANDPNLHVHCVIANACRGEDGNWSSVNSRKLHDWTMTLGRVFRAHLCREVEVSLGLETYTPIRPDGQEADWFALKCIPQSLALEFSTRRIQIENAIAPGQLSDAAARQRANFATRPPKNEPTDLTETRKQWREEARRHGVDPEQLDRDVLAKLKELKNPEQVIVEANNDVSRREKAVEKPQADEAVSSKKVSDDPVSTPAQRERPLQRRRSRRKPISDRIYEKYFKETVKKLATEEAYYTDRTFVAAFIKRMKPREVYEAGTIRRIIDDLKSRDEIITLQGTKPMLFSSREYFKKEQDLVQTAKNLRQERGARVGLKAANKCAYQSKHLNEEQSKAAFHLLSQSSALRVTTGVAGSGKSTTLKSVKKGFEKAGYKVVGTTLSGKAKCELQQKTGIPTRTVASYLYHLDRSENQKFADAVKHEAKMLVRTAIGKKRWERKPIQLPKHGVLIVDEAGTLDTHSMGRLLHHAKRANCTVVLVGDSEQLPPIMAGGPLEFLKKTAGYAHLETNLRQESVADREAVKDLRAGDAHIALRNYRDRNRLQISEKPVEELVEQWAQSGAVREPAKHIILTPTRKLEAEVNHACQQKKLQHNSNLVCPSLRHGSNRYYMGDRIRFHRSQRNLGIENAHLGTVIGVNPLMRTLCVRLDNAPSDESKKKFGATQVATVSLLESACEDLSLGYASTTHAAQGAEYDHAWVLLDGGYPSKELAYTQLTRGRKTTHLFATKQSISPTAELERLAAELGRTVKKDLARDVMSDIEITYEQ